MNFRKLKNIFLNVGFIEDFAEEGDGSENNDSLDDDTIWSEILENNYAQLFNTFNVTGEEREVAKELIEAAIRAEEREKDLKRRPKRQAGFPGATRKENLDR